MKSKKYNISEICYLNKTSISNDEISEFILYLDTSNIKKNKIAEIKKVKKNSIPSRAKRKVKNNTIVYSTVRPNQEHYGILENPDENLIVSTGFTTLDVKNQDINPKFLYYLLTRKDITNHLHKIAENSVSSYPSIKPADIGNLNLNFPDSITIQQKIASVLSSLDDKIELNNRINAELEAMAKTIYDYWFVQFDFPISPEKAEAMGQPELAGKPYKTSGGKMVYNEKLKREIPEGWEVGCFGDYSKVKSGFAFKSKWWTEKGVPVIKIKDISENYTLNQSQLSFVNKDKINTAKRFLSKPGDVVIAMTGATIGKFAIIPKTSKSLLVNQRVGLYNLGEDPFQKVSFLINSMKQDLFRAQIFKIGSGAAQPNISGDQLDSISLGIPPNDLIKTFNKKTESIYKIISNKIFENQQLTEIRDWLLPMLMNGQVTVR
ncbi:MAG: restriction endonuclease subunit S [bacterium]